MSELSLQSKNKLISRLNTEITANGAGEITGAILNKVLSQAARGGSQYALPCDPALAEGDIGKTLMVDLADGLVKIYAERALVAGAKGKWSLTWTDKSLSPQGRVSRADDIEFIGQPTALSTLTVQGCASIPDTVFTFVAGAEVAWTDIHIAGTLADTVARIKEKLTWLFASNSFYATLPTATSLRVRAVNTGTDWDGYLMTFSDAGCTDVTNIFTTAGGLNSFGGAYQVKLDSGLKNTDNSVLMASDWVTFTDGVNGLADEIAEATAFKAYIDANPDYGFTATRVGAVVSLEATDYNICWSGEKAKIFTDLPNVDLAVVTAVVIRIPKCSTALYVGILAGIETTGMVKYAVVKKDPVQTYILKAHEVIDISVADYDITGDAPENLSGSLLVACDGGQVRSYKSESGLLDLGGIVGWAVTSADDSASTQPITLKEDMFSIILILAKG